MAHIFNLAASSAVAALTFLVVGTPAQAYDGECKPPKANYSNIYCTSDDSLFLVNNDNYRPHALVNKQGKVVASLKGYDDVDQWNIDQGVFAVIKNNKVGYMNTQGKLVVPAIYDNLRDPTDKYDETWANPPSKDRILVAKHGKLGIIDTSNKLVMPFTNKYTTIEPFSEGMAPVMSKSYKWGFIDTNGKEVIKPVYDGIDGNFGGVYGFSQGLAGMKKGDKWGFITKSGKVAVPFNYDEIRPFSEQLAGVLKGDKWGFINGANQTVIPFRYADSQVERYSSNYNGAGFFIFEDGVAQVSNANQSVDCINKSGQKVTCN